jgi:hypothetical protein
LSLTGQAITAKGDVAELISLKYEALSIGYLQRKGLAFVAVIVFRLTSLYSKI